MGFRGSRVQIPPSRLVQRISPATGSVVGLFFPLRPPVRASGGSPPLSPAAPIGRHAPPCVCAGSRGGAGSSPPNRSEEHTSELQSHSDLVCRLLLEKK